MNKKLIAVIAATAMAGSIGFASVASAMEFNWYGSIRAGFDKQEADNRVSVATSTATDATGNIINPVAAPTITTTQVTATNAALDLGTGTAGSRFGIKGSEGLGNGLSAGFHIERSLTDSSLGLRHQNVWFKGRVGKLTLGQQNNPFRNAANWDQSWWLGGNNHFGDGGSRINGIRYDSNLSGPFSFTLMATAASASSSRGAGAPIFVNEVDAGAGALHAMNFSTITASAVPDETGIDSFIATAHYNIADVVNVNLGFRNNKVGNNANTAGRNQPGNSYDNAVISFNGTAGPVDWYIAYATNDDNVQTPTVTHRTGATAAIQAQNNQIANNLYAPRDAETVGVFLGFNLGDSDKIYLEYEDSNVAGGARADGYVDNLDRSATLFGYSHKFGPSTSFIVEYVSRDSESNLAADTSELLGFFKVDF